MTFKRYLSVFGSDDKKHDLEIGDLTHCVGHYDETEEETLMNYRMNIVTNL